MGISDNKTKKLIVIVTYSVAVLCLLLGFFLPLFDGKGILALQLPNVFLSLAKKAPTDLGKEFTFAYPILFMGKGKEFDFMAFTVLLYAFITFLALIMFIPIGLTFKKEGKTGAICAYVIEIAAALVLSLYLIIALEYYPEIKPSWNMVIAICGAVIMLAIQCCANKGKIGAVKLILFLLGAAAFLSLFYIVGTGKVGQFWVKVANKLKCSPALFGSGEETSIGAAYLVLFFESPFKDVLSVMPDAKNKALLCLALIVALCVLINYFIDIISLASNGKRKGLIFNVVRYGVEIAAVVALFITIAICKMEQGLFLCAILILVAIQLIISIVRLVLAYKKATDSVEEKKPVQDYFNDGAPVLADEPVLADSLVLADEPAFETKPYEPQETEKPAPTYVDPYYSDNYNASPYPYTPATYSAPEQTEDNNDYEPVAEYEPTPQYNPVQEYKPAKPTKPAEPEYEEPVKKYRPVQDYFNPVQEYKPVQPEPAPAPAPTPEPAPARKETPVYNAYQPYTPNVPESKPVDQIYRLNTVYQGPTDEFMRKLNNNEKIEFSMIFIEKSRGDIGKVPDYVIGGDNKKFFSAVFIYLGRMRSIVSDGLLNKMYKELNMLR
ncbi:MAG: DUF3824 domain-containing protein [Clostridia bacterium]|nr:DUF3824 domain-containing protein [Clostridia bacterium]